MFHWEINNGCCFIFWKRRNKTKISDLKSILNERTTNVFKLRNKIKSKSLYETQFTRAPVAPYSVCMTVRDFYLHFIFGCLNFLFDAVAVGLKDLFISNPVQRERYDKWTKKEQRIKTKRRNNKKKWNNNVTEIIEKHTVSSLFFF